MFFKAFVGLLLCVCFFTDSKSQDSTVVKSINVNSSLSGRYLSGQFNQFIISAQVGVSLKSTKLEVNNSISYRFNQTNGLIFENNWNELLTFRVTPNKKYHPVGYYHFDNNLLYRINYRHHFGLGVGTQKKWKNHSLEADLGLGFDYTKYNGSYFENTTDTFALRQRSLAVLQINHAHSFFKNKLVIKNQLFFRSSFTDRKDFLLFVRPHLAYKIFNNILVNSTFEYRFENVHLVELSRLNTTLLFGFTYLFNKTVSRKLNS